MNRINQLFNSNKMARCTLRANVNCNQEVKQIMSNMFYESFIKYVLDL